MAAYELADAPDAEEEESEPVEMADDELLRIVAAERRQSIGFEHDEELNEARQKSLEYTKGQMDDVQALPNRSKAVSTDVSDAIETILPDLIEIFTGGEDVATFQPVGEEDEEGAEQETDYIRHVIFNENDGFMLFYTLFKDALQVKTGVAKWWVEEEPVAATSYTGQPVEAVLMARQSGNVIDLKATEEMGPDGAPLYDFRIDPGPRKRAKVMAVPPEDFTVARDTVSLRNTTYCAMRSRKRAQELLADGVDAEIVEALPLYGASDEELEIARDTAGENDEADGAEATPEHRIVEVVEHYIRVFDGEALCLYRVLTGADEKVLIEKEKVDQIPFAAITPYVITHRFYGESIADRLMEIQRIKTAITRMGLDSGYFALNQRLEVAEDMASVNTIPDLLRNEPGVPIRSKNGQAVRPISSGGLSFDAFGALEYFSTVGEQRTGIVRNAQGLNPDTLHDTAKGAQALMAAAQKRIRLIARVFAETGIRDLYLGLHAMIRQGGFGAAKARLRNGWAVVDPTTWGSRSDMNIEIGLGSAGKEQELLVMREVIAMQTQAVQAQGGVNGPLVTLPNIHAAVTRFVKKAGIKKAESFFTDPANAPPQQPQPDPQMLEMQAKQQQAQMEFAQKQAEAQADQQLQREKQQGELMLKREQITAEMALKREQLQAELDLKREQFQAEAMVAAMTGQNAAGPAPGGVSGVHMGGEPG